MKIRRNNERLIRLENRLKKLKYAFWCWTEFRCDLRWSIDEQVDREAEIRWLFCWSRHLCALPQLIDQKLIAVADWPTWNKNQNQKSKHFGIFFYWWATDHRPAARRSGRIREVTDCWGGDRISKRMRSSAVRTKPKVSGMLLNQALVIYVWRWRTSMVFFCPMALVSLKCSKSVVGLLAEGIFKN